MIHKTDNLEAIVWQLYDAGFRPSIKYGAGKLSWVSLTAPNCTFIVKSQQMIDWAIDGMMEVHDARVFNRLQDAKTEFPLPTLQVRAQELLQRAGHRDPRRVQDGGERRMATQSRGREPEQEAPSAVDPQEQPSRDRHLQGVHRRLHADQVHPGVQRVRHLAVLQAGGADQ